MFVSANLVIFGNGLLPIRHWIITWTDDHILVIFCENTKISMRENAFFIKENILFDNVILSTIIWWQVYLNLNVPNMFFAFVDGKSQQLQLFQDKATIHITNLFTHRTVFLHNWFSCTLNVALVNSDMMQSWWDLQSTSPHQSHGTQMHTISVSLTDHCVLSWQHQAG